MQIIQNIDNYDIIQKNDNYFVIQKVTETNVIKQFDVLDVNIYDNTKNVVQYVCGENINGTRVVVIIDGKCYHADSSNANHIEKPIGISMNAANINDVVNIQLNGEITEIGWNLIPNRNYFFSDNGSLTLVKPTVFSQIVGYAKDINTFIINFKQGVLNG